jgi:threonine/homoserine/homoserine lactone efflux protein
LFPRQEIVDCLAWAGTAQCRPCWVFITYWLFIATAVILVITPGQDTFFILGRSLSGGRSAGIAAALGITAGSVLHTFAAAWACRLC